MESVKQKLLEVSRKIINKAKSLSRNQKLAIGGLSAYLLYKSLRSLTKKPKSVSGKVVFITGGANGIGRCLAIGLAKLGARVVIADIDKVKAEELVNQLLEDKYEAMTVHCDVSNVESIKQAAAKTRTHFGNPDILINSAVLGARKKIVDLSVEEWDKVIRIGLMSYFYTIKEFLPDMLRKDEGHIVNIASLASHTTFPGASYYCVNKAGNASLTEALRRELQKMKSNVKTSLIQPGFTGTNFITGLNVNETIMKPEFVADEIIKSILYDEEDVFIPRSKCFLVSIKYFVSTKTYDAISELSGAYSYLDNNVSWENTYKNEGVRN